MEEVYERGKKKEARQMEFRDVESEICVRYMALNNVFFRVYVLFKSPYLPSSLSLCCFIPEKFLCFHNMKMSCEHHPKFDSLS